MSEKETKKETKKETFCPYFWHLWEDKRCREGICKASYNASCVEGEKRWECYFVDKGIPPKF